MKTKILKENKNKKVDPTEQYYECLGLLLPCFSFLAIPMCIAIGGLFLLSQGDVTCISTFLLLKSISITYFGFCGAMAMTTAGFFKRSLKYLRKAKLIFLMLGLFIFVHLTVLAIGPFSNFEQCLVKKFRGSWIAWLGGPTFFVFYMIAYVWNHKLMRTIMTMKENSEPYQTNKLLSKV